MAALSCEICGGKLMAKAGGIFECDSCGMQYDKARIQEMVQEIKGTVKVEGTVEVTGTVKLDGPVKVAGTASAESLLTRAKICIEKEEFDKAGELLEKVLNIDPKCTEAYICQILVRWEVQHIEDTMSTLSEINRVTELSEWQNALRFANKEEKAKLTELLKEKTAFWEQKDSTVLARVKEIEPAQELLYADSSNRCLFALDQNGRMHTTDDGEHYTWTREADGWTNIKQVVSIYGGIFGLRWDGTVECAINERNEMLAIAQEVTRWESVKAIHAIDTVETKIVVGLTFDGKLLSAKHCKESRGEGVLAYHYKHRFFLDAEKWNDVDQIAICKSSDDIRNRTYECVYSVVGLTSDGVVKHSIPEEQCLSGHDEINKIRKIKKAKKIYPGILNPEILQEGDGIATYSNGWSVPETGVIELSRRQSTRNVVAINSSAILKADGKVYLRSSEGCEEKLTMVDEWKNEKMVAISSDDIWYVAAITEDGYVRIHYSEALKSRLTPVDWKLFDDLKSLKEKHDEAPIVAKNAYIEKQKAIAEQKEKRRATLEAERAKLSEDCANLKGLFAGRRRKEIEARLTEIEVELKGL